MLYTVLYNADCEAWPVIRVVFTNPRAASKMVNWPHNRD